MTTGNRSLDRIAARPPHAPAGPDPAEELVRLRRAVALWPTTRADLVTRLREEIARGRYRTDGRRVAAGMLEEERTLPEEGRAERR